MAIDDRAAYGAGFVAEVTARLDAAGGPKDGSRRPVARVEGEAVASNCGALPDGIPNVSNCG